MTNTYHRNMKEFNSFGCRTDTLFCWTRRFFRFALGLDTFGHDLICFCQRCDVFQFRFATAFLSIPIVITDMSYCFCCLWACIFYPCVYPTNTVNRRMGNCLFLKEWIYVRNVYRCSYEANDSPKKLICAISCYFCFLLLLLLPMHAVNMRLYYMFARFSVTNTLHMLKGLICVVYDILLVAVCYFGMWFVVCDSKEEEMNRKISQEAPKNNSTKNEWDVKGWIAKCVLSSIMYKL